MTEPKPTAEDFASAYAAALTLILCALTNDCARIDTEGDKAIAAGPKYVGAVLGFLTAHAADAATRQHGSREAAIDALTAQLAHVRLTPKLGELP
ncbi:hypothetical protein BHQ21_25995 [Mycobacterium sherrisii]|uniref:Uncharacterized protein n=1 Tax=Mycobacterium sherrisii TaxID=243061 RepID=A0A1E3S7U9_9MYCO|nr:hypothetical protein [Mycobacterium sherrisii]ODQ98238.1 hypothetical protein BHQ21_25995 [Mycobacterium sherrisii]